MFCFLFSLHSSFTTPVIYEKAASSQELQAILNLQQQNLPKALTEEEAASQGFLTIEHTFDLLKKMNSPYPHIVAKINNCLAGYALVMLEEWKIHIPLLIPFIDKVNKTVYKGKKLKDASFIVMGQVCVAKPYRGTGVFLGLYQHLVDAVKHDFDYIVTGISFKNTRSLRAHAKIGFKNINSYGGEWALVLLETKQEV